MLTPEVPDYRIIDPNILRGQCEKVLSKSALATAHVTDGRFAIASISFKDPDHGNMVDLYSLSRTSSSAGVSGAVLTAKGDLVTAFDFPYQIPNLVADHPNLTEVSRYFVPQGLPCRLASALDVVALNNAPRRSHVVGENSGAVIPLAMTLGLAGVDVPRICTISLRELRDAYVGPHVRGSRELEEAAIRKSHLVGLALRSCMLGNQVESIHRGILPIRIPSATAEVKSTVACAPSAKEFRNERLFRVGWAELMLEKLHMIGELPPETGALAEIRSLPVPERRQVVHRMIGLTHAHTYSNSGFLVALDIEAATLKHAVSLLPDDVGLRLDRFSLSLFTMDSAAMIDDLRWLATQQISSTTSLNVTASLVEAFSSGEHGQGRAAFFKQRVFNPLRTEFDLRAREPHRGQMIEFLEEVVLHAVQEATPSWSPETITMLLKDRLKTPHHETTRVFELSEYYFSINNTLAARSLIEHHLRHSRHSPPTTELLKLGHIWLRSGGSLQNYERLLGGVEPARPDAAELALYRSAVAEVTDQRTKAEEILLDQVRGSCRDIRVFNRLIELHLERRDFDSALEIAAILQSRDLIAGATLYSDIKNRQRELRKQGLDI